MTPDRSKHHITDLKALVDALPAAERERFERIFHLTTVTGHLVIPDEMQAYVRESFGSVGAAENQTVVKVTNLITLEGTLFNSMRAVRPSAPQPAGNLTAEIIASRGDNFCHPDTNTSADIFGRVRGRHAISAANIAQSDGFHGLVVFDEHDPLRFTRAGIADVFQVALGWARKAHETDLAARYFFFFWNCLWRGGASMIHGHAQMLLGRGMHYPRLESWRRGALLYRLAHGNNYFDDLVATHAGLGLVQPAGGAQLLAHLTPLREKEILVVGARPDEDFYDAVYHGLDTLVRRLGSRSFTLAFYWKPIDSVPEDWSGFPAIVRMVDRGDPYNRTSDVGGMDLFAGSVVASDPFAVAAALAAG